VLDFILEKLNSLSNTQDKIIMKHEELKEKTQDNEDLITSL